MHAVCPSRELATGNKSPSCRNFLCSACTRTVTKVHQSSAASRVIHLQQLLAIRAMKSSMASDKFLFRFWPLARRHTENRGGLRKNPQVRLAALDVIPAYNALKHGEELLLPRALRLRHRVGELVATAIRTPTLFIARTNSSTSGRKGTPSEAGYSARSRNGKTSSTRMSIPKCSSVIRAKSGACGPRGGRRGRGEARAARATTS
jgi:hypothetical protein